MFRERGILLDLYEDEKIVSVIRRHWISFLTTIVITVILIIVFFIGSVIVYGGMKDSGVPIDQIGSLPLVSDNLAKAAYLVFGPIYLLAVLGFFYISWLDYYLDVFVLTNKRILRLEQLVLFGQKVSETSYQHVQDVSSQVKGFLQTMLNIGTLFVETAGENENFSFTLINFDEDKIIAKMEEIHQEEEQGINEVTKQDNLGTDNIQPEIIDTKFEIDKFEKELKETISQEIKDSLTGVVCDIPIAPVIERKAVIEIEKDVYKDGRMITSEGVIWQSEQELTSDVLDVLNKMGE
jgi:hypothetical protein